MNDESRPLQESRETMKKCGILIFAGESGNDE